MTRSEVNSRASVLPQKLRGNLCRLFEIAPLAARLSLICFLLLVLLNMVPRLALGVPVLARTGPALVLAFAALSTSLALGRQLPAENAISTSLLISLAAAGLECVNARSGFPFGSIRYGELLGPKILDLVPWTVPLLWLAEILASRGMAQWVLRRQAGSPNYGWWMLGTTTLLALVLHLTAEAWGKANHAWVWSLPPQTFSWCGAPWPSLAFRAGFTVLLLGLLTPLWIIKKPGPRPPPKIELALVWFSLDLLFLSTVAQKEFRTAAWLGGTQLLVAAGFALRARKLRESTPLPEQASSQRVPVDKYENSSCNLTGRSRPPLGRM